MIELNEETREFFYINFKTHNIESSSIKSDNNNVIELGREDSQNFFGLSLFQLYVTLRSSDNEK